MIRKLIAVTCPVKRPVRREKVAAFVQVVQARCRPTTRGRPSPLEQSACWGLSEAAAANEFDSLIWPRGDGLIWPPRPGNSPHSLSRRCRRALDNSDR